MKIRAFQVWGEAPGVPEPRTQPAPQAQNPEPRTHARGLMHPSTVLAACTLHRHPWPHSGLPVRGARLLNRYAAGSLLASGVRHVSDARRSSISWSPLKEAPLVAESAPSLGTKKMRRHVSFGGHVAHYLRHIVRRDPVGLVVIEAPARLEEVAVDRGGEDLAFELVQVDAYKG